MNVASYATVQPMSSAPRDRDIILWFRRPTSYRLFGYCCHWFDKKGKQFWSGSGQLNDPPEHCIGWTEKPHEPALPAVSECVEQ